MSHTDIKYALRKLEFPACAKEALSRIEPFVSNRSKQNLVMHLINEFVFLERNVRDAETRRNQSTPVGIYMTLKQEFQVILVFVQYFSKPGPDEMRNSVFLSLFASNLSAQRTRILARLISTAISGYLAPLLSAAGCWLQQVGCATSPAIEVARSLISDFFGYCRSTSERLKTLPLVAPHFAANFITAITELYMNDQRSSSAVATPPDALLEVFSDWLDEHPHLCLASQTPLALPTGAIAMPAVTPLIGLIRWSVLLPLLAERISMGNMHMALLRNLMELKSYEKVQALNAQHLTVIANYLQNHMKTLDKSNHCNFNESLLYVCIERFAQIMNLALKTDCVFGNISQLLIALDNLPPHPLMKHVITNNSKIKA